MGACLADIATLSTRFLLSTLLLVLWSQPCAAEKIDLNRADAATLESLPGIGPVKAREIIRYRRENGTFGDWEELLEVKGIGEKTLEKIRRKGSLSGGITRLREEPGKAKKKPGKRRKTAGGKKTSPRKAGRSGEQEQDEPETIPWYSYGEPPIRARR